MLRYWTAPSPTKTRETPHCLAKTLPFPLTPKAKSATTTTTTTLWVLWYIFSLNNKPLFYSYSDFVFVLFGKLLARNTYCLQTLFFTCDTSRRYNPTIGDRDPRKVKEKKHHGKHRNGRLIVTASYPVSSQDTAVLDTRSHFVVRTCRCSIRHTPDTQRCSATEPHHWITHSRGDGRSQGLHHGSAWYGPVRHFPGRID